MSEQILSPDSEGEVACDVISFNELQADLQERILPEARQAGQSICLAFLEINSFSDLCAHDGEAGEELLRSVTFLLQKALPASAFISPCHEAQWRLVLPHMEPAEAKICLKQTALKIKLLPVFHSPQSHVTCSIGFVTFPADGTTLSDLISEAKQMLYVARHSGVNLVVCPWDGRDPKDQNGSSIPRWNGEELEDKSLLVVADKGLGNTIQFVRFVRLLNTHTNAHIVVACQKELHMLLHNCEGVAGVVDDDISALPSNRYDFWLAVWRVPCLFDITVANIPAETPYVWPDPLRAAYWQQRLQSMHGLKVGLQWRGNSKHPFDQSRSCSLADLAPLASVENICWVSLQPDAESEIARSPIELTLLEARDSFADEAAFVAQLDLVISVDTSIAHLAGAMGMRIWTALSQNADWRWLEGREDTPWYPTMRLFRQKQSGDWKSVFSKMAEELQALSVLVGERTPE